MEESGYPVKGERSLLLGFYWSVLIGISKLYFCSSKFCIHEEKKTKETHLDVIPQVPRSLACLPSSLYFPESSYVCFIYIHSVQEFYLCFVEIIEESTSTSSSQRKRNLMAI